VFGLRELGDVVAGVAQLTQGGAVGQYDRFVEFALPAPVANG
jgi:hypothetical protein